MRHADTPPASSSAPSAYASPSYGQCPLTAPQPGDYRSLKDGLWQQAENWEAWDGQGWVGVPSTAWPGSPDAQPPRTSVCHTVTVASFINAPRLEGDLEVAVGAVLTRSSPAAFIEFEGFRARNEGQISVGTFYLTRTGAQVLSGPGDWIPLNLDVESGSTFRLDEDLTVETTVRIAAGAALDLEGHTLTMSSSGGGFHTLDAMGPVDVTGTLRTRGRILVAPGDLFAADLHVESGVMELYSGTYGGDVFVDPAGTLLVRASSVATVTGDQFLLYGGLQGQQNAELVLTGTSILNGSSSAVTVPDLTFGGAVDQTLTGAGEYLDVNIAMASPTASVMVSGGMRIHGRLTVSDGDLDLVTGNVDLGTDGRLDESAGGRVRGAGQVRAVRSQNALGVVDPGLGFRLRSVPLGESVELRRGHVAPFVGAIDRYYEVIVDESFNHDLNATIEAFEFHPAELNGLDPAGLALYRLRTDGSAWNEMGGSVSGQSLRLEGVDHFSTWTAAEQGLMPVAAEPVDHLPTDVRLHSAFPNPFNPETIVRFDLPVAATPHIAVYGLSGRRIRNLLDGTLLDAGRHRVRWDGTSDHGVPVATGTYFVRLTAGGLERTIGVTLVR